MGLSQLNIKAITRNFRFLNYHWGKFALSFFLTCMSFSSGDRDQAITFTEYVVTIYFLLVSILFLILSIIDRQRDLVQQELDRIDILKNSPLFKQEDLEQ